CDHKGREYGYQITQTSRENQGWQSELTQGKAHLLLYAYVSCPNDTGARFITRASLISLVALRFVPPDEERRQPNGQGFACWNMTTLKRADAVMGSYIRKD